MNVRHLYLLLSKGSKFTVTMWKMWCKNKTMCANIFAATDLWKEPAVVGVDSFIVIISVKRKLEKRGGLESL